MFTPGNPQAPIRHSRGVESLVQGRTTSDGAGVKLTRVLGQSLQRRLDPFLMLDAFGSDQPDDYIRGFPDHPHRGFETITYMIEGRMRHRDSAGHEGLLESGGVQWMSAARGVIHSELPEQTSGRMEGFQLWLNLAAHAKLGEPWYQDFAAAQLPRRQREDGTEIIVIAGHSQGMTGAITRPDTEPLILDLHLPAGRQFEQALPATHNAFVYVYRGAIEIEASPVPSQNMAILSNHEDQDGVRMRATQAARVLLVAGRPLAEPIVQYGPFVMNSQEQIYQALNDYREGRLA